MQLRDGGSIENVTFSNLNIETRMFSKEHWWGSAEPICITAVPRREDTKIGHIRNVTFRDINGITENGILIYGDEHANGEKNIQNITLENINLHLVKRTDWPKNLHDLRPSWEHPMVEGPMAVVYARHAEKIRIRGLSYEIEEAMREYVKSPCDVEDCRQVEIETWS